MWRKLRIYLFGVGLGLIVTWALVLRNRNTQELLKWTPENRVMNEIKQDTALVYPRNFECILDCYGLNSLDMERLMEEGDVNFSKSQTRSDPKIYRVEYEDEEVTIDADFAMGEEQNELKQIRVNGEKKNCACL